MKRYAFNTSSDLKEGDMIKSPLYDTPMQVVKVLSKSSKFFNKETGDLSNIFKNSNQFEIRELKIQKQDENIILACKIDKK